MTTSKGTIYLELDQAKAPISVENFVTYAKDGFYSGTIFHRVIKGFMIQGGGHGTDMKLKPTRAPIKNEWNNGLKNVRGTIAMARTNAPNSATSQWYFNVTNNPALDGNYAVFGKILGPADLATLDAIGAANVYNLSKQLGPSFGELPLLNEAYLILVESAQIIPSALRITGFEKTASGFRIDWTSEPPGRAVDIQRSTDLASGAWTTISTNNSNSTFTDPNPPGAKAFYRVSVP